MEKKLPGVFANKVDSKLANNKKVDYSYNDVREAKEVPENQESTSRVQPTKNINQKLNDIFNSPRYVYKANVTIVLKDKTVSKNIIGQNNTHLITIDNELIPISDIIDIYFVE